MVQYISKDALVAELNRKKIPFKRDVEDGNYPTYLCAIMDFEDYINTLEVKEVDLDKEAELIANGIMISVQANKYNTVVYNTKRNDFNHSHLMLAARKGIELGLKASNPITAADRGTAEEIIINLKRVEKDYRIDLTREIEWLRNKVKKGD